MLGSFIALEISCLHGRKIWESELKSWDDMKFTEAGSFQLFGLVMLVFG